MLALGNNKHSYSIFTISNTHVANFLLETRFREKLSYVYAVYSRIPRLHHWLNPSRVIEELRFFLALRGRESDTYACGIAGYGKIGFSQ